jgi:preprotein translocase subunit SecA
LNQKDPVQAYQFEGSAIYEDMICELKKDIVKYISHVKPHNS